MDLALSEQYEAISAMNDSKKGSKEILNHISFLKLKSRCEIPMNNSYITSHIFHEMSFLDSIRSTA